MSRHYARQQALSLLYQLAVRPRNIEAQRRVFIEEFPITQEDDAQYFNRIVDGVLGNLDEIRSIISKYLRGWTIERQGIIDVAILSIGIFELLFDDEVPTEIAISEAVILADTFGTDQSRPLINAVLGNIDRFEKKRLPSTKAKKDSATATKDSENPASGAPVNDARVRKKTAGGARSVRSKNKDLSPSEKKESSKTANDAPVIEKNESLSTRPAAGEDQGSKETRAQSEETHE